MENLTYEAILRDPDLLDRLLRAAHRARSEAVHRFILDALRARFSRSPRTATTHTLQPSACG